MSSQNTHNPLEAPSTQAEKPTHEAVKQVTAPGRVRRYRAWLFQGYILTSLLIFTALTILVSISPVYEIDVTITRAIQSELPAWLGSLLIGVGWFGFGGQSTAIVAITLLVLYFLGLRWEAVVALIAGVGSGAVNTLIKTAINRPRPTDSLVDVFQELNSYSFPSGHVMFYVAFFGYLAFLSYTLLKRGWLRSVLVVFFVALIVLVGPSRIYMGQHWATDVIAGYLAGFLTLFAIIFFERWGKVRFSRRQPVAPGQEEGPLPSTVVPMPVTGETKQEKRTAEAEAEIEEYQEEQK